MLSCQHKPRRECKEKIDALATLAAQGNNSFGEARQIEDTMDVAGMLGLKAEAPVGSCGCAPAIEELKDMVKDRPRSGISGYR